VKFGINIDPHVPFDVLTERWRTAEDLGFDQLWVADHSRDYRDERNTWFDGWTVMAAMAERTQRIRIGTLVSNPILRHPVLLAKQVAAVDHLSSGRVELAIGTGIAGFDHEAVGVEYWEPRERVDRFREYVQIVDEVLRTQGPYEFQGRYYRTTGVGINPPTVQRPRPPLTIGGQSPTVRRVAAECADRWNTHGPLGKSPEEILEITTRQNAEMDEQCVANGRSTGDVKRSLLLFDALDPWATPDALERLVTMFAPTGVDEFVLFWPPDDRIELLERVATKVIPNLKEDR
jgi:alkanesulfonate monooxygenase SsuD/methylene tetrahydromethanopterin reductase-like flavin-dependent oxidoreductase (luciferase family)